MTFLYRDVIDRVLGDIEAGRLEEGDRLPPESALAAQLGVSRITIKRAMEVLQQEGVVQRYRGRGTFIARGATHPVPTVAPDPSPAQPAPTRPARIGFVLPELSDLFGVKMFNGIDDRCQEMGHQLVFARSRGSMSREAEILERWRHDELDGVIVFPVHREFYNEALLRAVLDRFPVVLVDRTLHGVPVASVLTDHYRASVELTSWMLAQGHTSLAFISPPSVGTSSLEDRHRGFIDTLEAHADAQAKPGLRLFVESVVPGHSTSEAFHQTRLLLRKFLSSHPDITGIVTSEYSLALILQSVLRSDPSLNRRQIQIACFDALTNYPSAETFPHVLQDETGIGRKAVELLERVLAGEPVTGRHYVDYRLVTDLEPS